MKMLVEFCTNNYNFETYALKERLLKDSRFEIMEHGCLGNCTRCAIRPFALVEGRFIEAANIEDLHQRILLEMNENQLDTIYDLIINNKKQRNNENEKN